MAESTFPKDILGFTRYIGSAYKQVEAQLDQYKISPEKLEAITPLYTRFIQTQAMASNPGTATSIARRERNEAMKALMSEWRKFLNENIRHNPEVRDYDLSTFAIQRRKAKRSFVGIPKEAPMIRIRRIESFRYQIKVEISFGKGAKKPRHASGSFIYLAVDEVGHTLQQDLKFRKLDYSTRYRRILEFPPEQIAKRAYIYACFSNIRGEEGPRGQILPIIIS